MPRKGKMSAGMRRRHAELQRKAATKATREAALLAEQEAEKEALQKHMASDAATGLEVPAKDSSSSSIDEEEAACVDANASYVTVTAGKVKVGQHLVIKGFTCKVTQVEHYNATKHRHAKVRFVGIDIFTGRRHETVAGGHHQRTAPVVTKTQRVLLACKEVECNIAFTEMYHVVVAEDENSKSVEEHQVRVSHKDRKLAKALRRACATHVPAAALVVAESGESGEGEARDGSVSVATAATGAGGNAGAMAPESQVAFAPTRLHGRRVMVTVLSAMGQSAVTDMKTQTARASKLSAACLPQHAEGDVVDSKAVS